MGNPLTHRKLVRLGLKWLKSKYPVVITEMVAGCGEQADVLGFKGGNTCVIECKAQRGDFLADRKKYFRRDPERGIGACRFYMAPKGLIAGEELPLGWGLIEVDEKKRVRKVVSATVFSVRNYRHEIEILVSTLRRIGQHADSGVSISVYTYESQNTTGLTIQEEEGEDDDR